MERLNVKDEVRQALIDDGWTIIGLSWAKVKDLTAIKGIGETTAKAIIKQAKDLAEKDWSDKEETPEAAGAMAETTPPRSVRVRRIYGQE